MLCTFKNIQKLILNEFMFWIDSSLGYELFISYNLVIYFTNFGVTPLLLAMCLITCSKKYKLTNTFKFNIIFNIKFVKNWNCFDSFRFAQFHNLQTKYLKKQTKIKFNVKKNIY
jgi:hypothetical protein